MIKRSSIEFEKLIRYSLTLPSPSSSSPPFPGIFPLGRVFPSHLAPKSSFIFPCLPAHSLCRDYHSFIIVYSITSPSSFDEVRGIKNELDRIRRDNHPPLPLPLLLVGNMLDLVEQIPSPSDVIDDLIVKPRGAGLVCIPFKVLPSSAAIVEVTWIDLTWLVDRPTWPDVTWHDVMTWLLLKGQTWLGSARSGSGFHVELSSIRSPPRKVLYWLQIGVVASSKPPPKLPSTS